MACIAARVFLGRGSVSAARTSVRSLPPHAMHLPLITTTSFVCTGASSPLAVMDPYVILQYLAAGALPLGFVLCCALLDRAAVASWMCSPTSSCSAVPAMAGMECRADLNGCRLLLARLGGCCLCD